MLGFRTLRKAGRWLASRVRGGGLILLYHRIADPEQEPGQDPFELCVTQRRFAEQLAVLRRLTTPLSLSEMSQALSNGDLPRRAVAMTFDDGYVDNLEQARPLLERAEIPATFFIVAGNLGASFWWDDLSRVLMRGGPLPPRLELRSDGASETWTVASGSAASRRRLLRSVHRFLRPLEENLRGRLIGELGVWAGIDPYDASAPRVVGEEELRRLSSGDLAEIGSHGMTHSALAALPIDRQRRELTRSRRVLENLLDRPVTSFSYPYGLSADIGRGAPRLLAEAGFERACTNVTDLARPGADPYRLPRYWVRNWPAEEFTARLGRWLGG